MLNKKDIKETLSFLLKVTILGTVAIAAAYILEL